MEPGIGRPLQESSRIKFLIFVKHEYLFSFECSEARDGDDGRFPMANLIGAPKFLRDSCFSIVISIELA